MFLDDCKPGVDLLEKNWNAQRPQGNNLFDTIFDSGWSSDDEGASSSAMRMLAKAVTADPKAIDDRDHSHDPQHQRLQKRTGTRRLAQSHRSSLWEVEDHGYYKETKCDYLALPRNCVPIRNLRILVRGRRGPTGPPNHRETVRTLQFMEPEDIQTVGRDGRHGRPGTVGRSRRNAWMRAHPDEPADMDRLKKACNPCANGSRRPPPGSPTTTSPRSSAPAWIPTGDPRLHDRHVRTQHPTQHHRRRYEEPYGQPRRNDRQLAGHASLASKLDEETIRKYGLGTGAGRNPFEIVSGALNSTTSNLTKPDPNDPTGKKGSGTRRPPHCCTRSATPSNRRSPNGCGPTRRARMLEDVYNERFNRIHPREYDGSYLTFPGISADIDLYPHQRKAVARILQSEEGTLVAHVVGAGKTVHRRRRMP